MNALVSAMVIAQCARNQQNNVFCIPTIQIVCLLLLMISIKLKAINGQELSLHFQYSSLLHFLLYFRIGLEHLLISKIIFA